MFRAWGKIIKENRLLRDVVVENGDPSLNRTRKVYRALEQMCYELDLENPVWLESNKQEFIRHDRTRFTQDNFIETIEFDFLEFHVIEEDDPA